MIPHSCWALLRIARWSSAARECFRSSYTTPCDSYKKWYVVVYDDVNPATGECRRRWIQAGTRRGDAEKLLAELVKRAHRGETVVNEKLTLGQYLTER